MAARDDWEGISGSAAPTAFFLLLLLMDLLLPESYKLKSMLILLGRLPPFPQ